MRESAIWKGTMLAVHKIKGVRLFRNNVGQGWVGRQVRLKPGQIYTAEGGEVVLKHARPLNAGLVKGSADGIGWRTITITQAMVGKKIAQFLSIETKTTKGRIQKEQEIWKNNVKIAGGIALIVTDENEAADIIKKNRLDS